MSTIQILNDKILEIFYKLNYDTKYASFKYSDRPDISDFQTNCAMPLSNVLNKNPIDIAENIKNELENTNIFSFISIDKPGFINVKLKDSILLNALNETLNDNYCGFKQFKNKKTVVIDFGGYNIAKEPHVGHLRSTVIGESIRRIYEFCGDKVISDFHQGDWGLNMGMVIEGIREQYPYLKCFKDNFNNNSITDLNLTAADLTNIYRNASKKAKEDEDFSKKVHETTKKLQDEYKPYITLWRYFVDISLKDSKELAENILGAHFDYWNGESSVHNLIKFMIRNLDEKGILKISEGAKIIDLTDIDNTLPPVIMQKSDGAFMYASTDIATILDRLQKFNPDLILYIVDARQALYFKQIFLSCEKIKLLNERHKAEHCPFGTMNGKDGKPFKTRDGELVKLRNLIEEAKNKISEKSKNLNQEDIQKLAVACIKFADLSNYRESNYVFDMDQFTNYEGKTGAYIMYSIVRINSILRKVNFDYELQINNINSKEEKDLILELSKFPEIIKSSYLKKAPNFIAEYAYTISKKFNSLYENISILNINSTLDKNMNSRISLIYLTKQYLEKCLYLLGIDIINKM